MSESRKCQPSFSARRRWKSALDAGIGLLAVTALVVMANYLAVRHPYRQALAARSDWQLSDQTLGVLRAVTNDVLVTLFYDRKDPFFSVVAGLLREYHLACPRVQVHTVDYLRDGGAAQQVFAQYQLAGATNKNLVLFDCEGRVMRVHGDALVQYTLERVGGRERPEFERRPVAFFGEKAFTAALLAVTSPKPLRAYFLTGHGEHGPEGTDPTHGYSKFAGLLRQNQVLPLPLSLDGTNAVPEDAHVLIVAGPLRAIPAEELEKIEHYLNQGGRLLALFNSYSSPRQCGLETVLARWGVEVGPGVVEDKANTITGPDVKVFRFGAHPIVQPLAGGAAAAALHLWAPRLVARRPPAAPGADAPAVVELLRTGDSGRYLGGGRQPTGSLSLAVAVEKGAVPGVVTERGSTRLVVVGDSFFLGNQLIESASNAEFAANAVNWLLDRAQLLHSVGPKPLPEFRLALSVSQMRLARGLLLGALPGAVLLVGALVWLRRRH